MSRFHGSKVYPRMEWSHTLSFSYLPLFLVMSLMWEVIRVDLMVFDKIVENLVDENVRIPVFVETLSDVVHLH